MLSTPIGPIRWLDGLDVIVTAILIYYFLLLVRGTRAVPIALGLGVLLIMLVAGDALHLLLLTTLLKYVLLGTAVALPILFQPELRRALEQLGRGRILAAGAPASATEAQREALAVLAKTAVVLARSRIGALIAIEQATGLRDFVESGTSLESKLSFELLLAIFTPRSPLHDGAVIVKGALIEAAGCFLPLSENVEATSQLGTRHRAALGLSEQTDAVVLVVSEQTGGISVARLGRLSRELDDEARLLSVLQACCDAARGRGRRPRKPKEKAAAAALPLPAGELPQARV
jgi:diadenylate cyclase